MMEVIFNISYLIVIKIYLIWKGLSEKHSYNMFFVLIDIPRIGELFYPCFYVF